MRDDLKHEREDALTVEQQNERQGLGPWWVEQDKYEPMTPEGFRLLRWVLVGLVVFWALVAALVGEVVS